MGCSPFLANEKKKYQYKVVSYGFKNSLSAFIRALDMVLGDGLEQCFSTAGPREVLLEFVILVF